METPEFIDISSLLIDPELQFRGKLNKSMVDQFAERMETEDDLEKFVPIDVYFDGKKYRLADGHHRIEAAKKRGHSRIWAIVHQGTLKDALLAAIATNSQHGLPLSRAERRRATESLIRCFPDYSIRRIADLVKLSPQTIMRIKNQLFQMEQLKPTKKTVGKDGKARPAKQKQKTHEQKPPKQKPAQTTTPPVEDASDALENVQSVGRPTEIVSIRKGEKEQQTYSCGVRFEPEPDDDFFDWIDDKEREQLREMQKACPATKLVPMIRNYTIQSIPEHDPQYLVSCLFSLFQPLYRKKLLQALSEKMLDKNEIEAVREVIDTVQPKLQNR